MNIVGFDPNVAKAHGYPTVPPAALDSRGGGAVTNGGVTGDCGYSYVELYDVGIRKYRMDTGFGVSSAAVHYTWKVHLTAPGYNVWHNYGGGLLFRNTWTNAPGATGTIPDPANVYAFVATGVATLANGFVCETGHPTDIQAIY